MAKIVELVGAPGVGKTTLYKEIEACWNKNYNWMPSQYFYPKKKITPANSGSLIINILRRIRDRDGKIDMRLMEEAGARFVELYPKYIDACWNNISCMQKKNLNGLDLRFQKVSYFYKLFQKIQTLREQNISKIAIVDEGLIHILASILCQRENLKEEKEEIDRLLQTMPLPEGIVSIETDVEENLKRLMQRKKVIPMHKSLHNGQLKNITRLDHNKRAIVNSIIESRNLPLLRINSADEIAINVSKIISFAENL